MVKSLKFTPLLNKPKVKFTLLEKVLGTTGAPDHLLSHSNIRAQKKLPEIYTIIYLQASDFIKVKRIESSTYYQINH